MIIDIHAHAFPFLGGPSGYDSVADHMIYFQKAAQWPPQPVRRLSDGSIVEDRSLWASWDDGNPTFEGAEQVDFRVGRYGRTEWTKDGVDYFIQLCPPSLQEMTAPPEYLLAEMDYAGVDMALIQNPYLYGRLEEYISEMVRQYPRRFIGQAQIYEPEAGSAAQLARLRRQVTELGLAGGVYYSNARFFEGNFEDQMDDAKFLPFWEEVSASGIAVFADIRANPTRDGTKKPPLQLFMDQMRMFSGLVEMFPSLTCVLVHGVPMRIFRTSDSLVPIPDEIWEIWRKRNFHIELMFPVQVSYPAAGQGKWELSRSSQWDYPYREIHPMISDLYRKLGPERLLWGSDIPFMMRNCTYKQSIDYLVRYCDFISPSDMDLILGGNAARILKIAS